MENYDDDLFMASDYRQPEPTQSHYYSSSSTPQRARPCDNQEDRATSSVVTVEHDALQLGTLHLH